MKEITGKVVFITGGAQGIGLGMARAFAREGAKLALADIDDDALKAAQGELSKATEVAALHLDVRDRDAYDRVADEAEEMLGPVSVVCNNAGVVFPESSSEMNYEMWDLALVINLGGVVNGVQTFLPRILQRGEPGHIVNTASAAGIIAAVGTMYSTSKYAVVGLSESLRKQLEAEQHPIGVSVLCPGAVATNIAKSSRDAVAGVQIASSQTQMAQRRVERLTPKVEDTLARYEAPPDDGAPPDAIGEMVAEAVKTNRPFVLTDRAATEMIKARTETLLDAMPAENRDDEETNFGTFRKAIHRSSGESNR